MRKASKRTLDKDGHLWAISKKKFNFFLIQKQVPSYIHLSTLYVVEISMEGKCKSTNQEFAAKNRLFLTICYAMVGF